MQVKWNHSGDVAVRTCKRKAFYVSRFANPRSKDGSIRREAFLLKQSVDVPLWRGNIVHKTIERQILPYLKKGERADFGQARDWAVRLIDMQAEFSRTGRYRTQSKEISGDSYCVLRSDLSGQGCHQAEIDEVKDTSILALKNLEESFSDLLERARFGKNLESEKEIRFSLDDRIFVEAIVDFMFFEVGRGVVLVDWKSGLNGASNAREQLFAYAYAALRCGWWSLTSSEVELIEASLMSGNSFTYAVSEEDIDDVDDRIFGGSQLLEPIFAPPVNDCSPDEFASADSPGSCDWCVVKEICNGKVSREKTTQPALSFGVV